MATRLAEEGIQTRAWYCPPLYGHPGFQGAERIGPHGDSRLPVTEELADCILGLPFHSFLSEEDVVRVCGVIRRDARPRESRDSRDFYSHGARERVA
jgi:dTDP-4-amino-4,6-dideoxygalactose transaminase